MSQCLIEKNRKILMTQNQTTTTAKAKILQVTAEAQLITKLTIYIFKLASTLSGFWFCISLNSMAAQITVNRYEIEICTFCL